jgi:hypothetical protein
MSWRKTISRVAMLLVVGVALNVGLAWSCALWSPLGASRHSQVGHPLERGRWAIVAETRAFGCDLVSREDLTTLIKSLGANPTAVNEADSAWLECRAGWPLRSFYGRRDLLAGAAGSTLVEPPCQTPTLPPTAAGFFSSTKPVGRGVPLEPLPLGLVTNVLLFAGVAGAVLLGPSAARRRWRRRRGCCIACGYQLAGLIKCPECSAPRTARVN